MKQTIELYRLYFRIQQKRHRWDWIDCFSLGCIIVLVATLTAIAAIKMGVI